MRGTDDQADLEGVVTVHAAGMPARAYSEMCLSFIFILYGESETVHGMYILIY